MVDVVEDHRLLLGGDPAGEATTHRDADALLYLLLEPECRPRDELVRVLVEQEDRTRVDLEDLPRPLEQRIEQLVEPQVRERGVGDGLQPPDSLPADSPDGWNHTRTRVFYDQTQKNAKAAAQQVAKLFADASTGPMTPRFRPFANGAELVVVVGKSYQGSLIGSSPSAPPPQHQAPHTIHYPSASLSQMRAIRRKLPFRVEYPTVIDRNSRVDPEPPNPRVYTVQGHKMARLVFTTGVNGQYWGIQETNWGAAPALSEKNFIRHFGHRTFEFFYSGQHLHMVVLKENRASYWVVNTLDDALSPETMIEIARGLRPVR